MEIEVIVDGDTYRGSYIYKSSASGGSVVVHYGGGVAEAPVIGRQDAISVARNLLAAIIAKRRLT
jgi:hypothetical protein